MSWVNDTTQSLFPEADGVCESPVISFKSSFKCYGMKANSKCEWCRRNNVMDTFKKEQFALEDTSRL